MDDGVVSWHYLYGWVCKSKVIYTVKTAKVADEKSTEAVKVFVVKKDQNLTAEQIKAYCKENLTAYKCPKHIEFRTELPKTNVGKILRRSLKEEEMAKK